MGQTAVFVHMWHTPNRARGAASDSRETMTAIQYAADDTAMAWAAWSEATGKPLIFTADGSVPDDYPENPGQALTAARLVEMVDRRDIDDERALELADALCHEEEGTSVRADVPETEVNLEFADREMAAVRRGYVAIDLESYHQAAAEPEQFGPVERRLIANGDLLVDDDDDLALRQELLERYEMPGGPGRVPKPPGKGRPPTRLRQELI
jgi:hypothetical protein